MLGFWVLGLLSCQQHRRHHHHHYMHHGVILHLLHGTRTAEDQSLANPLDSTTERHRVRAANYRKLQISHESTQEQTSSEVQLPEGSCVLLKICSQGSRARKLANGVTSWEPVFGATYTANQGCNILIFHQEAASMCVKVSVSRRQKR